VEVEVGDGGCGRGGDVGAVAGGWGWGAGEARFGGEEVVDTVEGVVGDDAFLEEGLEFLRTREVSLAITCRRGSGWDGVVGWFGRPPGVWLTFFIVRNDRLVSMTRWRSSDTMVAGWLDRR